MTLEQQIEFFEKHHYLNIPAALSPEEVASINAAIDRDREQFPALWSRGNRMQSAQCLLSMPEADCVMRHPSFFEVARHVFDGDICFEEFSVMIRAGSQQEGAIEGWHRDSGPNPDHRMKIKALSSIFYLTDVDETTARYSLIPASMEQPEPKKWREDSEQREGEVEMLGPAGTVILVNAGIWHCGKWGYSPRERRTIHVYYGQKGTPNLSNHTLYPRRLWDVPDEEQRRFYSKFNDLTRETAQDYCR
jgi:hypothetical protein